MGLGGELVRECVQDAFASLVERQADAEWSRQGRNGCDESASLAQRVRDRQLDVQRPRRVRETITVIAHALKSVASQKLAPLRLRHPGSCATKTLP